ncbi:MAG: porin family protein [Moraxella sp.]|nr:porin family protein [Moraxella sp.]
MKPHLFYIAILFTAPVFANTPEPNIPDKTDIYQPMPEPQKLADTPPKDAAQQMALDVSEQDLLNNPPLLQQALYASVLNNHVNAIALLLPLYEQLPSEYHAGSNNEMLLLLARASLAKENGKHLDAIGFYKKALAQDPNIHAARFALAQSFFNDKQYRHAKAEFDKLKDTPNLPQEIQVAIGYYLGAIDKKDDWQISISGNYTQDKNITNSPDYKTVNFGYGEWTLPKQESAQGLSYQLSASKDIHLDGRWHTKSEFDLYGKWYWDNHDYDDMTVRASSGLSYQTAKHELAITPYFERRIYADNGYSREMGVRGEISTHLTNRHRLRLFGEYGNEDYDDRPRLDGHRRQAGASWLWLQNSKQYWTLSADFSHKDAHDLSEAYYRRSLRLGWVHSWGNTNTALSLSVARRHFTDPKVMFLVPTIHRKDMEYHTSLSIWDNRISFWGITPRLVGTYQRVDSNHPFYDYDKHHVFVQLSKSF